jgi:hypothetical protein
MPKLAEYCIKCKLLGISGNLQFWFRIIPFPQRSQFDCSFDRKTIHEFLAVDGYKKNMFRRKRDERVLKMRIRTFYPVWNWVRRPRNRHRNFQPSALSGVTSRGPRHWANCCFLHSEIQNLRGNLAASQRAATCRAQGKNNAFPILEHTCFKAATSTEANQSVLAAEAPTAHRSPAPPRLRYQFRERSQRSDSFEKYSTEER